MFYLFGGGKVVGAIADEIGIRRSIFKTALTEERVNFAHIKLQLKVLRQSLPDVSDSELIEVVAPHLINPAYRGLKKLEARFPEEPDISTAMAALVSYAKKRDLLDE